MNFFYKLLNFFISFKSDVYNISTDGYPIKTSEWCMIYPNPAKDKVYALIYLRQSKEIDIELFSMNGKKVQHSRNVYPMGKYEISLEINSLRAGKYLVKIAAGDK